MFKLVRYEFRKTAGMLLTLLGIIAGLEVYFYVSVKRDDVMHTDIALLLMFLSAVVASIFVFVKGVTSYSSELKSRSSYLLFMTPTSTLKIVGSKFLYTFFNGLLFAALFGALGAADLLLALRTEFPSYEAVFKAISKLLSSNGIYLDRAAAGAVFMLLYVFADMMAAIALAYLAITVGHTLFRDKKWRWLPSLGIFAALTWGVNWIYRRFPSPLEDWVVVDLFGRGVSQDIQMAADTLWYTLLPSLIPMASISVAVILVSMFVCAYLLKRKVSL